MAEKRSRNAENSDGGQKKASVANTLQALRQEVLTMRERNLNLVARLALIEGNAERLGIDPEELYKPLP
jgi:hypothetical protein